MSIDLNPEQQRVIDLASGAGRIRIPVRFSISF